MRCCICVLVAAFFATAASGEPIVLQIDQTVSSAEVELCLLSGPEQQCSVDSSRAAGSVTIALDCPVAPSEVILHDFQIQLVDTIILSVDFGPQFGTFDGTTSNAEVLFGDPGDPLPPAAINAGAFTAIGVPVGTLGDMDYSATLAVCFLLGHEALECDGTIDLGTLTFDPIDVSGTLVVSGNDVTLTVHVEAAGQIDPEQPVVGMFRVVGDATARGILPAPCCPGDLTGDDRVALNDLKRFGACLDGPNAAVEAACRCADLDEDGDTDLEDYAAFSGAFTGP